MILKNFAAALLLLLSFAACAQQSSKLSRKEWLNSITANAVTKQGGAPSAGYALYYTQVGDIKAPYLVYVPASYNAAHPSSVVFFLHGAILARDSFHHKDPAIADEPIFSIADAYNTIVVFPFCKSDLAWPAQPAACENIITILEQVKQHYSIDAKKVYIGGISMGGIATCWFVNNKTSVFAGFYAFSAMLSSLSFRKLTSDKPLYTMNAKDDQTFSYSEVRAIYDQHKGEAPGWHFNTVETGGHRFIYGSGGTKQVMELLGYLLEK